MRLLWAKLRLQDPLSGILYGSFAAVIFPYLRDWFDKIWAVVFESAESKAANLDKPLLVASFALLLLIIPKFWKKSLCLFRSWRAGIIRGSVSIWMLTTFLYWVTRRHALILISFSVCVEILIYINAKYSNVEVVSLAQMGDWIPQAKSDSTSIEFDKPIEGWEEDAIGRQDFVRTILTRVLIYNEPAIGVTADFGEGKSSVLHLIEKSIRRGQKAIAVPFRAWLPSTEETFLDSLFNTANIAIRERYFLPTWRSIFRKYRRVVLGVAPKSWEFIGDLLPADSQSKQIEELTTLFSKLPVRVVFLLDEIDRMHLEELNALLKVLRGAPELKNVSYVCAFNKEALSRLISATNMQFGCQYLDKFFPVQVELPRIDGEIRECLFSDRLFDILDAEKIFQTEVAKQGFAKAERSLWYDALHSRLTNFRIIGQVLRGFESSLRVVKEEVNAFDLLIIECVRLLLPTTYQFVYQFGDYFHDPVKGMERWQSTPEFEIDEGAKKRVVFDALDKFFGGLEQADRNLARGLLVQIFPVVRDYFREKSKGLGYPSIKASGERRIRDDRFFERYFTHAVPATRFGEKEMNGFIESIKTADEVGVREAVEAVLPDAERNDLRRIDFFRRLRERVAEIPGAQARWLAVDISKRTGPMLSDHIVYIVAKSVVFAVASKFQGTNEMQRILEDVVRGAASDRFASDIVFSSVSQRETADEIASWNGFDTVEMQRVFGERMRSCHPAPVIGPLPSKTDDAMAFSRWRHYVPADVPYLVEFFRSAFDFDIKNLGIFLQWLLPGNIAYSGSPIEFVEGFYSPVSDIADRLKRADEDKVQWEPSQAAAIKRFWDFYNHPDKIPKFFPPGIVAQES